LTGSLDAVGHRADGRGEQVDQIQCCHVRARYPSRTTESFPMKRVRVVWRKFDGSLHWNYETDLLGEDEHGVWLGAPTGTPVQKGTTRTGPVESPHVLLLPRQAWWTA